MSAPANPIDESDLRGALAPLRPDPEAFAEGVRRRLREAATVREASESTKPASPWLSVAASVMPLPLLGVKGVTTVPLSQLPLLPKLVGWAALPATGFFALGLTILAWLKIRRAQRSADPGVIDAVESQQAITRWWRTYGAIYWVLPVLVLILMWWGQSLPLLLLFIVSGVALVGMVLALGRANALSRATVAQGLSGPLMLTMQLASGAVEFGGFHLLDQAYMTLVLFVGATLMLMLAIAYATPAPNPLIKMPVYPTKVMAVVIIGLGFSPIGALLTSSLWNPITTEEVVAEVESFDEAPYSSSSWDQWAIAAVWLNDTGRSFDATKPTRLIAETVEEQLGGYCFVSAWQGGVRDADTARRIPDFAASKAELFDPWYAGRRVFSFEDGQVHALVAAGGLSQQQRDRLEGRLLAALAAELNDDQHAQLSDVLATHELLTALGRPVATDEWREAIHEMLVRFQRVEASGFGQRGGGFGPFRDLDHGDDQATVAAIRLMEIYGVPEGIDTIALRSFLRPSYQEGSWRGTYDALSLGGLTKFVARQRLAALPDLPPLTWQDYVRYEQPLIFASLLVLLCFVAVFGSPARVVEDPAATPRHRDDLSQ